MIRWLWEIILKKLAGQPRHQPVEQELDGIVKSIGGNPNQQPIQAELLQIILAITSVEATQTTTATALKSQADALKALTIQVQGFGNTLSEINAKLDIIIEELIAPTEVVEVIWGTPVPIQKEK